MFCPDGVMPLSLSDKPWSWALAKIPQSAKLTYLLHCSGYPGSKKENENSLLNQS